MPGWSDVEVVGNEYAFRFRGVARPNAAVGYAPPVRVRAG